MSISVEDVVDAFRERFWSKVDMSGNCWMWRSGTNNQGYGKFWFFGRTVGAHRVAYMLSHGETPDDALVMHSCDNPGCVRPDHLSLGSYSENSMDCINKGRNPRGDATGKTRVSDADVPVIRSRALNGERTSDLASEYGVSPSLISGIKSGAKRS